MHGTEREQPLRAGTTLLLPRESESAGPSSQHQERTALGRDKGVFRGTLILVGVAEGAGSTDSGGAHATFGFPQGRSDYEPEPEIGWTTWSTV